MKVAIVNYGMGNITSVKNSLNFLGFEVNVINSSEEFSDFEVFILPGVGAFGKAMEKLNSSGLSAAILNAAKGKKKIIGICLGMQLLGESSTENGVNQGLGLVSGHTVHLSDLKNNSDSARVPRMGWYDVHGLNKLTNSKVHDNSKMYFAHSFAMMEVEPSEQILVSSFEGTELCVGISHGSVVGLQFHPEKSGELGISVLEAILSL